MHRINLVDPLELFDQYLIAEYKEIFMVETALKHSISLGNLSSVRTRLSREFTLHSGHVKVSTIGLNICLQDTCHLFVKCKEEV